MNHPIDTLARARVLAATTGLRAAVALCLALLATACGPGTGGTGVGPIAGVYLTSAVQGVTSSGLSATSVASSSDFLVSFAATGVRLEGTCWVFNYEGDWVEVDGVVRVNGFYRSAPAGTDLSEATATPATLVAQVVPAGVFVTLLDAQGATLATFAPAARVPEAVAPALPPACLSVKTGVGKLPG